MRVGLFENFIINEKIKQHYNQGKDTDFSFWRDSNGNEVDLIVSENSEIYAYEMKSGATVNSAFFKRLDYWANLSKIDANHKIIVYGGEQRLSTIHGQIIPWNEI